MLSFTNKQLTQLSRTRNQLQQQQHHQQQMSQQQQQQQQQQLSDSSRSSSEQSGAAAAAAASAHLASVLQSNARAQAAMLLPSLSVPVPVNVGMNMNAATVLGIHYAQAAFDSLLRANGSMHTAMHSENLRCISALALV